MKKAVAEKNFKLTNYQPKGGMCASCKHKHRDCSFLDFSTMPVIERDDTASIVKCSEHHKCNFTPSPLDGGGTEVCECGAWR